MRIVFSLLLSLLLFLLSAQTVFADVLAGRVIKIADGDTLTIMDSANQQHRIRLSGIDAPKRFQSCGTLSKAALSALAFNKEVRAECGKRDQYGLEVCKIIVNGTDINLEQVRAGMAWWDKQYAREQSPADQAEYEQAEFQAKIHRLGLWADKNPIPPWEWTRK